jgi:hypothetical protein
MNGLEREFRRQGKHLKLRLAADSQMRRKLVLKMEQQLGKTAQRMLEVQQDIYGKSFDLMISN